MVRTLLAASLLSLSAGTALAQVVNGPYVIRLEQVASGLTAPVQGKSPNDGSGRMFIVDQAGTIRIFRNGVLLPTPFLNITALLSPLNPGYDERGLLGLAFHPDYAQNGRFFVHYTAPRTGTPADPCFGTSRGCSSEVIAEFRVSADNPDVADPNSRLELLRVPKPQFNHAGGGIDFGPDGMLYFSFGDGGGANDGLADVPPSHGPGGNAQNLSVPLGKVLRFDVSTPGTLTVPADNPFVGVPGAFEGIWAYGFRNPYSLTFDDAPGGTGQLIVADVGQNLFEEVDFVSPGLNYGWPRTEGLHCFDPFNANVPPPTCDTTGLTPPVTEYDHTVGIAIVSGHVYRGNRMPALRGLYLFGDFSTSFGVADGHLFFLDPANPAQTYRLMLPNDAPFGLFLKGFGRDSRGELYALATRNLGPSGSTGVILHLTTCAADFNADGFLDFFDYDGYVDAFETGDPAADINGDDFVDFFDYDAFIAAFESGC